MISQLRKIIRNERTHHASVGRQLGLLAPVDHKRTKGGAGLACQQLSAPCVRRSGDRTECAQDLRGGAHSNQGLQVCRRVIYFWLMEWTEHCACLRSGLDQSREGLDLLHHLHTPKAQSLDCGFPGRYMHDTAVTSRTPKGTYRHAPSHGGSPPYTARSQHRRRQSARKEKVNKTGRPKLLFPVRLHKRGLVQVY